MPIRSGRRHKFRSLVRSFYGVPWTITTEKFNAIDELVELRAGGYEFTRKELEARLGDATEADQPTSFMTNGIAVLPLVGVLAPRMNLMMEISGGTSMNQFGEAFSALVNSSEVKAIVMDVASPGGTFSATAETADLVYAARSVKPVIAFVRQANSGGYWIASAASEIVASPSADIGSIGVIFKHTETSKADEQAGRKTTVLTAGINKGDGNSAEPLSKSARANLQEFIDDAYVSFVSAVARNRRVSTSKVEADFGQGKSFLADKAVALGMADRIGTLDDVLAGLVSKLGLGTRAANSVSPRNVLTQGGVSIMWEQIRIELAARGYCTAVATEAEVRAAMGVFLSARSHAAANDEAALTFIKTQAAAQAPNPPAAPVAIVTPAAPLVSQPAQLSVGLPAAPLVPAPAVGDAAVLAERERIRQIRTRGATLGIAVEAIDAAIEAGTPLDKALVTFTDNLAAVNAPVASGMPRVAGSAVDNIHKGAVEALFARVCASGPPKSGKDGAERIVPQVSAEARPFERMGLMQIASATLQARGMRVQQMYPDDIAEAFLGLVGQNPTPMTSFGEPSYNSPGLYPDLLSALANKIMDAAVQYASSTYNEWTFRLQPVTDFKPRTLIAMGATGELPELDDNDEFGQDSNTEEASFIQVGRFGKEFAMTPVMMANDDLQGFSDMAEDYMIAHELTVNRKAVNLLTGNPTLVDAIAFFHASHGNLIAGGSGGVPSAAQMSLMRQDMRAQKAPGNKRRLRFGPKIALVPIELETAAEQTFLPATIVPVTDTTVNVFRSRITPIVEPMLSDASAAIWYALADPRIVKSIVVAFMAGYENGGRRRSYFNAKNGNQYFQIEGRFAAAVRNWRGAVMNTGS